MSRRSLAIRLFATIALPAAGGLVAAAAGAPPLPTFAAALVVAAGLAWQLAGALLAPIETLRDGIGLLAEGHGERRGRPTAASPLGRLALSIDRG